MQAATAGCSSSRRGWLFNQRFTSDGVFVGQMLFLLGGSDISDIYFKCYENERVSSIFRPRQHILEEVEESNLRLSGLVQHREGSSLSWRTTVAQSPTNVCMFLSDFSLIPAPFSGTRQF